MNYIDEKMITFTGNRYLLNGEVLLDCNDRIHNYSRVPLHKKEGDDLTTVPELLTKIKTAHAFISENSDQAKYEDLYFFIDILMADHFVHHGEPLKAAEMGCNTGSLSSHIAALLDAFDPKADLVCISNTIGTESDTEWLDIISMVDTPEGLAFLASDFHNTMLRDDFFDLTVINGTATIPEPAKAIAEAGRITKGDGLILCYSEGQYLLDDFFKMMFPERREWRFSPEKVLFKAKKKDIWIP